MVNILVLCDDTWHPGEIVRAGLAPLQGTNFHFDIHLDSPQWTPGLLSGYPLVVLARSSGASTGGGSPWMSDSVAAEFLDFVRAGGGLLAVHSGTAGYAAVPLLRGLLGGVFSHHPAQCLVTVTPLPGHPLGEAARPFTQTDEHYHMILDDPQADVFLTTTSQHGSQPGGWTRVEGQGRVCVLTPGHNLAVWLEPSYQALIQNALVWCGKASQPR